MLPRFSQDYRTLIWAFIFFPLVPALGYARPNLVPYLVPLSLYLSYCAGIFTHSHNHCPVFRNRFANGAYASWLSIFYGFPTFAWVPTHNQNHHVYVNGEGDCARTTRHSKRNTMWSAVTYPFRSSAWQLPLIRAYAAASRRLRPRRYWRIRREFAVILGAHGLLFGLALWLHGAAVGGLTYFVLAGMPALLAPWSMMFTNYVQHVDCDPQSPNDHSRNFVSPFWNWLVFDSGYHTVHHEHPGVHWSRYRVMHRTRAAQIDPRLNVSSIFGYCLDQYLLRRR